MNNTLLDLALHGREERYLEYKRSLNWGDAQAKAKITRTILGMSNIRDGGTIVIGVAQDGENFVPEGATPADLESFAQDTVAEWVNGYADPFAEVSVSRVSHEHTAFVVIQVAEFTEIPVVCKQNGPFALLKRGAIYTRSRRKHETVEIPSQVEMRELLDVSIEKGFRRLIERLRRAGISMTDVAGLSRDREEFERQVGGL